MKKLTLIIFSTLFIVFLGCNKKSIDRLTFPNDFFLKFSHNAATSTFIDTNVVQISNNQSLTCTIGNKGELNTEYLSIFFPEGTSKLSGDYLKSLIGVKLPFDAPDTTYPGKFTSEIGFALGGKFYSTYIPYKINKSGAYGITIQNVELFKSVAISPTKSVGYYDVSGRFNGYVDAADADAFYVNGTFRVLLQEYK
jgi:hypothetical protein